MLKIPVLDKAEIIAAYEARKASAVIHMLSLEVAIAGTGPVCVRTLFDSLEPTHAEEVFFALGEARRLFVKDELTIRYVAALFGDRILPSLDHWGPPDAPELLVSWGSFRAAVVLFRRLESDDPAQAAEAQEWARENEELAVRAGVWVAGRWQTGTRPVVAMEWLAERPTMLPVPLVEIALRGTEEEREVGMSALAWFVRRFGRAPLGEISPDEHARIDARLEADLQRHDSPFRATKWWPIDLRGADPALFERPLKSNHPDMVSLRESLGPNALLIANELLDAFVADKAKPANRWCFPIALALAPEAIARRLSRLAWTWAKSKNRNHRNLVSHVLGFLRASETDEAIARLALCAEGMSKPSHRGLARYMLRSIAVDRGQTLEELVENASPNLGLESDGTLVLGYGPRAFRVRFLASGGHRVEDDKGKSRAKLPKPGKKDDAELAAAAYARFIETRDDYKYVVRAQIRRLECALRERRRWSKAAFLSMLERPVMRVLCTTLVFSDDGGTFRVSAEGELLNSSDDAVSVASDVGLAHPLELDADARARWLQVFADYELIPAFPQLERSTFAAPSIEAGLALCEGWRLHAGALVGLLGEGWQGDWRSGGVLTGLRASVADGEVRVHFEGFATREIQQTGPTEISALELRGSVDAVRLSELLRDLDEVRTRA